MMRISNSTMTAVSVVCACGILVSSCAQDGGSGDASPPTAADTSPEAVIGTTWEWVSTVTPVDRVEASDPARYTIRLDDDGAARAKFDCNSGAGSYEMQDNRITFGVFAATRMACPEDTQDNEFMSQLERVATFFIQDDELFLEMPFDSGTMRFRSAAD